VQEAHGKDKLAVLLLSVDPEYFPKDDSYKAKAKKIYETKKVDWPNVFLVKGWTDAVRTFNRDFSLEILREAVLCGIRGLADSFYAMQKGQPRADTVYHPRPAV